ncbi:DHH family phosphoesterase [Spirochaetia bacterium 38H-sp]|uniref:DHH family phosphoesterase n=1 Tax=Rarispira pelagica TaxID=3141764 RepID=A0ABU9U9I7_9SPIR
MISSILQKLSGKDKKIYIISHSYPDYDSIASAVGLCWILQKYNIPSVILYHGEIESPSLVETIRCLDLELQYYTPDDKNITSDSYFLVVDAAYGNSNVISLPGTVIASIDHHETLSTKSLISDIRPDYGACSTIVCSYMQDLSLKPNEEVATLLLTAIFVDTDFLKRKVSSHDIEAISFLNNYGSLEKASSTANNSLIIPDVPLIKRALEKLVFYKFMAFFYLDEELRQEVLAIIADTIIKLEEITLVVGICKHKEGYKVSVRSEDKNNSAGVFIQTILREIGVGGGHVNMAGGFIKADMWPGENFIFDRCLDYVRSK